MPRKITAALAMFVAALGLAAGLFAFPARADNSYGAKSLDDLQALGYVLNHGTNGGTLCWTWAVEGGNGAPWTVIGEPDQTTGACATDPAVIQARIDQLIADYPPLPATTTTAPEATTTTAAVAAVTTVTTPADTTPTVAAPVDAPAAPAQTVTVTDPTVQAQIDALNAKIDALTGRVDKLAAANTAAWDAFVAATGAGASAPDAALAARSGYLNSLYGL